ncbi:uncharacterized protein LOC134541905 [Bacillus rossius redtenbacheri]|uniref:uncharacterized protein LOC134541905 n=1 Tax=Bacillus rossius redtenbacheri TaxID=93214 RepID=UPI002FDEF23A
MGVDWRAWCVALLLACLWALGTGMREHRPEKAGGHEDRRGLHSQDKEVDKTDKDCVSMAQRKQEIMKTVMDCTRKTKKMIKPKDMKDIQAQNCPRSPDAKCLIGCALESMQLIKNHKIDQSSMEVFIMKTCGIKEKEKLIETMKVCSDKVGKQKECLIGGKACDCMKKSGVMDIMMQNKRPK